MKKSKDKSHLHRICNCIDESYEDLYDRQMFEESIISLRNGQFQKIKFLSSIRSKSENFIISEAIDSYFDNRESSIDVIAHLTMNCYEEICLQAKRKRQSIEDLISDIIKQYSNAEYKHSKN